MPVYLWIVLLLAAVMAAGWMFLVCPRMTHRPQTQGLLSVDYAHRGLHSKQNGVFENTLTAFQKAAENGYGIELDVRLTADGVPVVFHDATLKRLFGRTERICDLSFAELRTLRFPSGETIPSFDELLKTVAGRVPLLVELKTEQDAAQLCPAVAEQLSAYKGKYCVESFDPRALRWYRTHQPQVMRGQLITRFSREDANLPRPAFFAAENLLTSFWSRPDFISYDWRFRANRSLRTARRLFGFAEFSWTVQDAGTYAKLKQDGAVCIFEGFCPGKNT